ncbi:hypothetical protein H1Q63_21050 [Desmonostoc muscorum CCALA 125]|nr:hypothetical protein [Desmonostoc muscorum CCALA 125]
MEVRVQNCNIRYPRVNDAEPKAIACVITSVVQGIDHIPANKSLQRFSSI